MEEVRALGSGLPGAAGVPGPGTGPQPAPPDKPGQGPSFGEVLRDSLGQVNRLQNEADAAIRDLATGGRTTLHETMVALEKAELSFRLLMQVRNKIVEAYQQVMRMQV